MMKCGFLLSRCMRKSRWQGICSFVSHRQRNQESVMNVFDRRCKRIQREQSALAQDTDTYDYIHEEISHRLADRVYDVKRKFDIVVSLGCRKGFVGNELSNDAVGLLCNCDSSPTMLKRLKSPPEVLASSVMVDEEFMPFRDNSVDLVISCLSLHWVNNLPSTFQQIFKALRNDGVLLAALFGGDTLYELRCSFQLAEMEREGGFGAHISPFTSVQDIGSLLNRAGFMMLTVDVDEMKVNYPSMMEVMWDIKGMGESNAAWNRKLHLQRDTILSAASIYKELYGNPDGTVPATFQIIYLIGWKPDSSQPKPAKRGSATVSLKDLSKIDKVMNEK